MLIENVKELSDKVDSIMEKEKEKDHRSAIAALSTSLQNLTEKVEAVSKQLDANNLIREAKQNYYKKLEEKLSDPQTGRKTFWNAFKNIS